MRIEIHRRKMAACALEDGRVAVGYDVLVPAEDCVAGAGGTTRLRDGAQYRAFPEATWAPDLPHGWPHYAAWLDHEKACEQLMLAWLHEHCPETADLAVYPLLWRDVDAAGGLDTVVFEWNGEVSPTVASAVHARTRSNEEYEGWLHRMHQAGHAAAGAHVQPA